MAVMLERYGPVLDPAIEAVKELTRDGTAEIRVPIHPEASGMAADLNHCLISLYQYLDSDIHIPGRPDLKVHGKADHQARRFHLHFIFEDGTFEVLPLEEFSSHPFTTIIDNDTNVGFKSRVSVDAKNSQKPNSNNNTFIHVLGRNGIILPGERNEININLAYHSRGHFPIGTYFQHFNVSERFERARVERGGAYYPVSAKGLHRLDQNSWGFFHDPVFWDSWSVYASIAFNKIIGRRSYEEAAQHYSDEPSSILRHSVKAEANVVELIRALKEKRNPSEVADSVGCPHEYRGIYLNKILKTIRWLCNPDSLQDPAKRRYLQTLAEACKAYGFRITSQELTYI